jgi:ketosteroid isomerase-like protein
MKRSNVVLVLLCAAMVACAQEMTQREEALVRQVVRDRATAWVKAMNNAQLDSIATFYLQTPDLMVLWPDGRRTEGWDSTRAAIRQFYGGINYMNFVVSEPVVQVLSPEAALSAFRHSTDIVQRNGQRLPVQAGQGTILWLKDPRDNLWKIDLSHVAVSSPSGN